MTRITGARFRDRTVARLGGDGDNWHMSWAPDDSQIVALCDGLGFPGVEPVRAYNTGLFRMIGDPPNVSYEEVVGFPHLLDFPLDPVKNAHARYYGFGTLCVDGRIYQFGSSFFRAVKVVWSADGGVTWRNQDGSSPVVWEDRADQSRETMVFFEEPDSAFALLSVLQMGKDYGANTDGFVYLYSPNGLTEGTMNQLVLARVPKDRIPERAAYEFFAGADAAGEPAWSADIRDRSPVLTFPPGWVNIGGEPIEPGDPPSGGHPYAWHPSVTYNPALGVYLMANWGMAWRNNDWFTAPNYLGLWSSPTPWGPWEQFHEDTAWAPGGDANARCYQPQISPKWISEDGRSFWLVWTDFQPTLRGANVLTECVEIAKEISTFDDYVERMGTELRPYYAVNAQRVDLRLEG
jgi:hypothetical protein